MSFCFQQFVIDPALLVVLLVMRYYNVIEFTLLESADLEPMAHFWDGGEKHAI